uniref:Uncharacterized protein n=1 Tax=viral metagenome TaxID=1070528 RepID=A0A6C0KZJ1_9ZZZZ|tara:strand:- start:3692 stop:3880 length:189 start_codon:yes stop_codon:yes gene_type:complete
MTEKVGESDSLKWKKSSTEELRVWHQIQWKKIVEKWKEQEEILNQTEEGYNSNKSTKLRMAK